MVSFSRSVGLSDYVSDETKYQASLLDRCRFLGQSGRLNAAKS